MLALPRLRPLDIQPTLHQRRASLLLRDPLELSDRYLILPQALGPALFLCDGNHDAPAITLRLRNEFGIRIEQDVVDELIAALDDALFLQNPRAAAALTAAVETYRAAPFRPPSIAGNGYPADPDELRAQFDSYLDAVGPVRPMPPSGRALISPHIDYQRGHKVYARVWKEAAAMARVAELVIVLGADHYGGFNQITLTRQNYATPYGILPTALDLVDALAAAIGEDKAFAGELYHRREHSIELVLVWLHHMRGGQSVPVLPILTGSFQPFLGDSLPPAADPTLQTLLTTLPHLIAGHRTLIIASGDLAHIGPAFGGEPVDLIARADLRAHDDELISHLAAGDAESFWRFIAQRGDDKNVCGLAPFYLTLNLLGQVEGQRTGYAICPADEHNTSVVSVCGMVFG